MQTLKFLSTYREIHDVIIDCWIILQNFMKTHCNFLAREKLQICLYKAKNVINSGKLKTVASCTLQMNI